MVSKIFIASDEVHGVSGALAHDLLELVILSGIAGKGDVQLSDLNRVSEIPEDAVIAIGGGDTAKIQKALVTAGNIEKIRAKVTEGAGFFGICAGLNLAAESTHNVGYENTRNPINNDHLFGFIPETAYTHWDHKERSSFPAVLIANGLRHLQPYIYGSGFNYRAITESKHPRLQRTEVVTQYGIDPKYPPLGDLPIAALSIPAEEGQGAVFVSGTHPEALVPNSKIYGLFTTGAKGLDKLLPGEADGLEISRHRALDHTIKALKHTFGA